MQPQSILAFLLITICSPAHKEFQLILLFNLLTMSVPYYGDPKHALNTLNERIQVFIAEFLCLWRVIRCLQLETNSCNICTDISILHIRITFDRKRKAGMAYLHKQITRDSIYSIPRLQILISITLIKSRNYNKTGLITKYVLYFKYQL